MGFRPDTVYGGKTFTTCFTGRIEILRRLELQEHFKWENYLRDCWNERIVYAFEYFSY